MPPHDALPYSHPFRRATLAARKPTRFDLRPDEAQRAAIAARYIFIIRKAIVTISHTEGEADERDFIVSWQ